MQYILILILAGYVFMKRGDMVAYFAKRKYMGGDALGALRQFGSAVKMGGMSVNNRIMYSYLLLRAGELDRARTMLNLLRMQGIKPADSNRVRAFLAIVYWKEGDIDLAIEVMEEIIANYRTTTMYQNLGLFYVLSGNGERALEFCLEAYDYNSDDKIILDNLAQAHHLNGEHEQAAKVYGELMEKEPHFPEAYYGYGSVLIALGKRDEGIEMIEKSLEKNFTFLSVKQRHEVEEMLNDLKM